MTRILPRGGREPSVRRGSGIEVGLYGAARAGFGPGVSLLLLARAAPAAVLAGIDPSRRNRGP